MSDQTPPNQPTDPEQPTNNVFSTIGFVFGLVAAMTLQRVLIQPTSVVQGAMVGALFGAIGGGLGAVLGIMVGKLFEKKS